MWARYQEEHAGCCGVAEFLADAELRGAIA